MKAKLSLFIFIFMVFAISGCNHQNAITKNILDNYQLNPIIDNEKNIYLIGETPFTDIYNVFSWNYSKVGQTSVDNEGIIEYDSSHCPACGVLTITGRTPFSKVVQITISVHNQKKRIVELDGFKLEYNYNQVWGFKNGKSFLFL